MDTWANLLRAARKARGWSLSQAAGRLDSAADLESRRRLWRRWEAGTVTPGPYYATQLENLLSMPRTVYRGRSGLWEPGQGDREGDHRVREDLVEWLARRSGHDDGTIRQEVTRQLPGALGRSRGSRRTPARSSLADRVYQYYGPWNDTQLKPYRVTYGGNELVLSVAARPEWTDLRVPLATTAEQADLDLAVGDGLEVELDDQLVSAAARRIADISVSGTRAAETALYRLLEVRTSSDQLRVTFGTTSFVEYALTMDLLESELVGTINDDGAEPGFPVRDRLLPDLATVTRVGSRICAGGVVALFAAIREPDHLRSRPDIALLVQQRSSSVLNAVGRLATIPKGFHEPLTDLRRDSRPSATLFREIEEELFRRSEVDSSDDSPHRHADPLHLTQLSEPMRWLVHHRGTGAWHAECVGLGLNLVSGNYELACLVFVEDPQWWTLFGGSIEGNWETQGLRVYSLEDVATLQGLVKDAAWSNEGLFAFATGLRRLHEITGSGQAVGHHE